jgi:hypothetical protein
MPAEPVSTPKLDPVVAEAMKQLTAWVYRRHQRQLGNWRMHYKRLKDPSSRSGTIHVFKMTRRRLGVAVGLAALGLLAACGSPSDGPLMPTPMRLSTTRTFNFNGIRLSPPPVKARPAIDASQAWRAADITETSASYQLVLAQWHSTVPLSDGQRQLFDALVWVVIGTNVKVPNHARGGPSSSVESAMWPVDAGTGKAFGELTYPPSASTGGS